MCRHQGVVKTPFQVRPRLNKLFFTPLYNLFLTTFLLKRRLFESNFLFFFFSLSPCRLLTEQSELPFCVDGSWAAGARVDRDGSGLSLVWSRQIQQLNRVSLAGASAVTEAFPSPQALLQVRLNWFEWSCGPSSLNAGVLFSGLPDAGV